MTSNTGSLRLDNGEHVSNEVDMAGILNDYFASIFTVEDTTGSVESSPAPVNTIQLGNWEFTKDNVRKTLENININKTPGPDRIAPRVLNETRNQICNLLSMI